MRHVVVQAVVLSVVASTHAASGTTEPTVTRVRIRKAAHELTLLSERRGTETVVAVYRVAIGPGGAGPKRKEGDMVTPIGRYHVTTHQPSQYRVFLRLDYPNADDQRRFAASRDRGDLPRTARIGGDIGIHGPPVTLSASVRESLKEHDWTAGCIAVDDDEIRAIGARVRDGTPVDIED